ncbi:hypothetical protein E0T84_22715 [Mycobacterium sp. DBP42]|nr:hypothetical protein E0T84_22715 [Mycobacterium sp. DBP42]
MFVAKWFTRASRVRIVIAKFDGRWTLPGGPYPIPELVALVGGILATLFALPRLGHPIATGLLGVALTVTGVAMMRRMPYSPVRFTTRVHRVLRLYSSPVSYSSGGEALSGETHTVVRPRIEILDVLAEDASETDLPTWAAGVPAGPYDEHWDAMFDDPRNNNHPVADLFG